MKQKLFLKTDGSNYDKIIEKTFNYKKDDLIIITTNKNLSEDLLKKNFSEIYYVEDFEYLTIKEITDKYYKNYTRIFI